MSTRLGSLTQFVFPTTPARRGETTAGDERHAAAATPTAPPSEEKQVVIRRFSEELGIPAERLQAQRQRTGLRWGQILIANRLSQKAGMSFDHVVSEFRSGKGWGEIARDHHVNLGKMIGEVRASRPAIRACLSGDGHAQGPGEDVGVTSASSGEKGVGHGAVCAGPPDRPL